MPLVEPTTLDDAIASARKLEAGEYYTGRRKESNPANDTISSLTRQVQEMLSKLTTIIREKENTRNQSYRPTGCFNCGRQKHRARECPEPPRRIPPQVTNPRDANLCEVENSDNEAYVATRSRHQPYTVNRSKKGEMSKEPTGRTVNQPRQTEQARPAQQEERIQSTQPVEMLITAEPAKEKVKNATPRVKHQRGPSVVDQASLYNHLEQVLKRPIIIPVEVDYVEDQPQRTSAARCNMKIRNKPVVAVLDSGAAVSIMSKKLLTKLGLQISEPSNAVVVTANRTRERALGKLKDVALQLGRITVPTDFQVIESMEEMILLGMSWFKKLRARLYFDEHKLIITHEGESIELPIHQEKEEEDLDEVESYLTDDQEDLYTNPWIDEQSPAAYLMTIEEVPTPEETERPIQPLKGVIEELVNAEEPKKKEEIGDESLINYCQMETRPIRELRY
ncbi:3038_t:CDS:2 [Acaulospora morrowiae]|uniref:3038_t:CDS:1 n=1 Tax=Acaulospora morrowiae TaxID=94023 RepID=A0A9N9DAI2_9GLOM|nr:3038_t:CDS:2 [Acaulospora morrowiae]